MKTLTKKELDTLATHVFRDIVAGVDGTFIKRVNTFDYEFDTKEAETVKRALKKLGVTFTI